MVEAPEHEADVEQPLLPAEETGDRLGAARESTLLSSLVVHASGAAEGEEDEIRPAASTYGTMDAADAAKGEGAAEGKDAAEDKDKDKDKTKKKEQKAVSDALKTDMAAERTFFKWLWTGLHTGAIGSFIFVAFDGDKNDPTRLVVVGLSWVVALALVLYGAFVFYRRRQALRTGDLSVIPTFTREHSPLIVVTALALVVGTALVYAWHSTGFDAQRAKDVGGSMLGAG